jgi:hypothetical protein
MRWSVNSLNVVIRRSLTILELFASKDEMLLIGRDALILDLNSLSGESLDEDLHASMKMQDYIDGE